MSNNEKRSHRGVDSPVKNWNDRRLEPGVARGRGRARAGNSRQDRVWGRTPNTKFDQSGLTELFNRQNQLKAALSKQARLAKLDVSEVRSTEVERLRQVNQLIVDASAGGKSVNNPFSHRDLTAAQILSETMIERQGRRDIFMSHMEIRHSLGRKPVLRRNPNYEPGSKPVSSPWEFTILKGPLARCFHRAVVRGYQGRPNQWLRGPTAAKEIDRLRQKNLLDPFWTGKLSLFERGCPLAWVVNSHSTVNHPFSLGFLGERLHREDTESVTLARQARAVNRLPKNKWPRSDLGLCWPTYPTLSESWTMFMTGKPRLDVEKTIASAGLRNRKLPTRQVKPGLKVRVISQSVIGLRASVPVPKKFLAYFSYRWGFLILNRTGPFPNEFASFLANCWKRDQTSMFLSVPLRYNDALRRSPAKTTFRLHGFKPGRADYLVKSRPARQNRREKVRGEEIFPPLTPSPHRSERGVRL